MSSKLGSVLLLALLAVPLLHAQERYEAGRYRGFTRLAHESNIVELATEFEVREANGIVHYPRRSEGVAGVLVELRDDAGLVHATTTDGNGRFHFEDVREGRYTFKAARDGFQSVAGVIVVKKRAKGSRRVDFDFMPQ